MSGVTLLVRCRRQMWLVAAAAIAVSVAGTAVALSVGGQGGTWPQTWPKELEPLRKQAWTWDRDWGPRESLTSYHIPFANRDQFEAAWPHLLKVKDKGSPLTLLSGEHLHVKEGKTAGVIIYPPLKSQTTGPLSVTRIELVVDGNIVDLNRIPLPMDARIIDKRFKEAEHKPSGKAGAGKQAPWKAAPPASER